MYMCVGILFINSFLGKNKSNSDYDQLAKESKPVPLFN